MNTSEEEIFRQRYQLLSDYDMMDGCIFNNTEGINCDPTIEECGDCDTFDEFASKV